MAAPAQDSGCHGGLGLGLDFSREAHQVHGRAGPDSLTGGEFQPGKGSESWFGEGPEECQVVQPVPGVDRYVDDLADAREESGLRVAADDVGVREHPPVGEDDPAAGSVGNFDENQRWRGGGEYLGRSGRWLGRSSRRWRGHGRRGDGRGDPAFEVGDLLLERLDHGYLLEEQVPIGGVLLRCASGKQGNGHGEQEDGAHGRSLTETAIGGRST